MDDFLWSHPFSLLIYFQINFISCLWCVLQMEYFSRCCYSARKFFFTRIYTFKFKLMAGCTLSIWFPQSADKTFLPLKEIEYFFCRLQQKHTKSRQRQRTTAVTQLPYILTDEIQPHDRANLFSLAELLYKLGFCFELTKLLLSKDDLEQVKSRCR